MDRWPSQVCPVGTALAANTSLQATASHGAAGNWSAYAQLIASTDYDSYGLIVIAASLAIAAGQVRIAIGGAGSEQVIATIATGQQDIVGGNGIYIPIFVPAGSRIAFAGTSDTFGSTLGCLVTLVRGSMAYASSRGTIYGPNGSGAFPSVDAGATANTKGAYTELAASTSRDAVGYTLWLLADASNTAAARYAFDLAVGGAGSEVIILPDYYAASQGFRTFMGPAHTGIIWTPIPAGTRIAARCQSNTTAASDRVPMVGITLWER